MPENVTGFCVGDIGGFLSLWVEGEIRLADMAKSVPNHVRYENLAAYFRVI
jgi:hypothetical protein